MSTDLEFETVSNDVRDTISRPVRVGKTSPMVAKLMNDETLFIPADSEELKENTLNHLYDIARKLGYKLNKRKTTHKDRLGFMLWFEKREEAK